MSTMRSLPSVAAKPCALRSKSALAYSTAPEGRSFVPGSPGDPEHDRPVQLLMAGFEALDLLNIGLVVTNASGQLLLANQTAEQILEARDGLSVTSAGVLRAAGAGGSALLELVRQAASPAEGKSDSKDLVLAVQRPSGKRPLTLLVRSIAAEAARTDNTAPACLIFIMDPEFPMETAEAELRQLYGLTSTEACLANLLMEGKTLDECCQLLDIRRSTARTHLQHLFEKVGVQRQSELVSLLLKSVGMVRTRTSPANIRSYPRT
jgi:DNA-binding CsgD family transcriptional regulator